MRVLYRALHYVCAAWLLLCPARPAAATPVAFQASFSHAQRTLFSSLDMPIGILVDSAGNFYTIEQGAARVLKRTPQANGSGTIIGTKLHPYGSAAIDASGNLYIPDGSGCVWKETLQDGSCFQSVVASDLGNPSGVAVDASGNVYICCDNRDDIVKATKTGATTYEVKSIELNDPAKLHGPATGIAVDASGCVYVSTTSDGNLLKLTPTGSGYDVSQLKYSGEGGTPITGITAYGLTLDASGNIYMADAAGRLLKETRQAGDTYVESVLATHLNQPMGLCLDPSGRSIYVACQGSNDILQVMNGDVDFGTLKVGSSSETWSLVFNFTGNETLSEAPSLRTLGTTGLDFTDAGTVTLTTNGTVHSGDLASVDVTFTPRYPGLRNGAVVLTSSNGTLTVPIHGTGRGPVAALNPATASVVDTGGATLTTPFQSAVDGSGNLYVSSYSDKKIFKIPAGGGSATVVNLGTTPSLLTGVAVDGAGNLFVAGYSDSFIYRVTPSGSVCQVTVTADSAQIWAPTALALDPDGNLFIADYGRGRIVRVAASSLRDLSATTLPVTGSVVDTGGYAIPAMGVTGLAVDGDGNLYGAILSMNEIVKIPAGGGSHAILPLTGLGTALKQPLGVCVDGLGYLYISDSGNSRIVRVALDGTAEPLSITGATLGGYDYGITADATGHLYIADWSNDRVVKVDLSFASLSFPSTPVGASSAAQRVQVCNQGNADLTLPVPASGTNPFVSTANFTQSASFTLPEPSGSPQTLTPGASWTLNYQFRPTAVGTFNGSAVLTDDSLGLASMQVIALSGTANVWMATLTLDNLNQTYTGLPLAPIVATSPANLAVTLSYTQNGASVAAPVNPGSYLVTATINDANYTGSTTGTLVIGKASATVTLGNLSQSFTGSPLAPTVTTSPANLAVALSYTLNGAPVTAPTNAGSYVVTATISDPNYGGSATGTFVIVKPALSISMNSHALTLVPGGTASAQILLSAEGVPGGSIKLSASGLPANTTLTFSSTSIDASALPVTVQLRFQASSFQILGRHQPAPAWNWRGGSFLACGMLALPFTRKGKRKGLFTGFLGILLSVGLISCAGSKNSNRGITNVPPEGTYAVTLTAEAPGVAPATATFMLTVTH